MIDKEEEVTVDNFRAQQRAWDEGIIAYQMEKRLDENPYPPLPPFREHDAWQDGWKRAEELSADEDY